MTFIDRGLGLAGLPVRDGKGEPRGGMEVNEGSHTSKWERERCKRSIGCTCITSWWTVNSGEQRPSSTCLQKGRLRRGTDMKSQLRKKQKRTKESRNQSEFSISPVSSLVCWCVFLFLLWWIVNGIVKQGVSHQSKTWEVIGKFACFFPHSVPSRWVYAALNSNRI